MVKLKCKLVKTQENRTEGGFSVTFTFKPTLEEWKKKLLLQITTPDPAEDTKILGLPVSINDTIILEMITKEEQTTLDPDAKKAGV